MNDNDINDLPVTGRLFKMNDTAQTFDININ